MAETSTVNFTLRLPPDLDARVKEDARANRHSKNDHIIVILEERFKRNGNGKGAANKGGGGQSSRKARAS